MDEGRRLPASAGAEWLLGGLALLRKSPFGLGLLGLLYGVLSLGVGMSAQHNLTLFMVLEVATVLVGPLLIGGMIYAAREVDRGHAAVPGHLLQGVHDRKVPRLLATLLPQVGALVLIMLLLGLIVGPSELSQMATALEKMQGQATPDPALVSAMPFGKLALWLLLAIMIGILAGFFTFVGLPQIMFTQDSALHAMGRSFRACLRNLPALVVFFVLAIIAVVAFYFVLLLVGLVFKLVAGPAAMQVAMQLLVMAVMLPVITGAMYVAWRQMLGSEGAIAATATSGFEA